MLDKIKKKEKHVGVTLTGIVILASVAYFVFYTFAPFGEAGDAAFAPAMIAPVTGFIFLTMKDKPEENSRYMEKMML